MSKFLRVFLPTLGLDYFKISSPIRLCAISYCSNVYALSDGIRVNI